MARAGYCGACGAYVYLTADGSCSNGHPAQYVSHHYDVPEQPLPAYGAQAPQGYPPAAQPAHQAPAQAWQPQPAYQQPVVPTYAVAVPAVVAPRRKRTGLIVASIAVLFLLVAAGLGVAAVAFGYIANPIDMLASPQHQKVQAAGSFVQAVTTGDLVRLSSSIPAAAAAAADPAYWAKEMLESGKSGTLKSSSWKGDVLTQVYVDTDGAQRTITFTAVQGDKVKGVWTETDGDAGSPGMFVMVRDTGGWKVLALGDEDGQEWVRFTPETVRKLQDENK